MTKARRRKARANVIDGADRFARPTAERATHNEFDYAGAAYRCTPVIASLLASRRITQAEHDALEHYREQAHRAQDDVAQSSTLAPERMMGGGCGTCTTGHIPATLLFTSAIAETGRIERDLGQLADIARAVAVDDVSLSRWCCAKHGGRERYDGDGRFVAMVPSGKRDDEDRTFMDLALIDLKMAARRIVR